MYMPIIDILKPQGQELFGEYMSKGIVPLAYEVCWNEYTPEVKDCMEKVVESGSKLWVNSLWESLCGGLCDDVAWESVRSRLGLRQAARHRRDDDSDRPSGTADLLPAFAGAARLTAASAEGSRKRDRPVMKRAVTHCE